MAFGGTGAVTAGPFPDVMTYSGTLTLGAQQYTIDPLTGPLALDPIHGFAANYGVVQAISGSFSITNASVTTVTGTFTGVAAVLGSVGTNVGSVLVITSAGLR